MAKKKHVKKPVMVKVGRHLVDPNDVAAIKGCGRKNLYIIVLKSQPNPEFPMWASEHDVAYLVGMFNILGADDDNDFDYEPTGGPAKD